MDTDDLSRESYDGILVEAEKLTHDLTLQYGLPLLAQVFQISLFKSERSGDLDWKWNQSRKDGMSLRFHLQLIED